MLHEFLTSHRAELVARCRSKVARRLAPSEIPIALDHGVPLFLQQLVETLRCEQRDPPGNTPEPSLDPTGIGHAASVHGADLLRLGYTVDQVVHDYGDLCQAVTELAGEKDERISAGEFHTLNRCLDNAIAGAVTSFGRARQVLIDDQAETVQQRLSFYSRECRRLVDIALQSYSVIKTGHVGVTGATGTLLFHTLEELRALADRSLPEIRLAYLSGSVAHLGLSLEKEQD